MPPPAYTLMTPISSRPTRPARRRPGDALGGAVPGAGLAGGHGRIGHQVDVGPGDAAAVGGDDDRTVHLRQLRQPLRAVRRVDEEAAGTDREHVGAVAQHEQRAGLRPHDPVDAVAQWRSGRHASERIAHLLVGGTESGLHGPILGDGSAQRCSAAQHRPLRRGPRRSVRTPPSPRRARRASWPARRRGGSRAVPLR